MPYSQSKEQLFRILKIVKRLYALEELKISQLSIDYAVCTKTIRRNLQIIANIIPLQKRKSIYSLDSKQLAHSHNDLQFNLLSAFASNANILLDCFDKENLNEDKIAFAIELFFTFLLILSLSCNLCLFILFLSSYYLFSF